jgi:DNA-binding transcriptional MerR regulator
MGKISPSHEIPDKLYFPIREVAEITGVEPYVLRFWEKEFPAIRPPKGGTGHRRYRRKDIETILEIKRLLYDQGFTIAGARSQMQKAAQSAESGNSSGAKRSAKADPSVALTRIRRELSDILTMLNKP